MWRHVAALALTLTLLSPALGALSCTLSATTGATCSRDGAVVLQGAAATAAHVGGAWRTTADGSLRLVRVAQIHGADPVLGVYAGQELHFEAGTTPFVTRAKSYARGDVVGLEYSFPDGAEGTAHDGAAEGQQYDVIANAFAFVPSATTPKLHLSWANDFVGPHASLMYGPSAGVSVLFDDPQADVLVLAPANHFLSSSAAQYLADGSKALLAVGATSTLESVPANFTHRYLLYGGDAGVNAAVIGWGALMQQLYNTTKIVDPTLTGLSYQTDNGAQYCFCNEGCDSKLLAVSNALKRQGVPVTLVSFQGGWWKNKNIHTPACAPWCVSSWEANATKVPMGVKAFQKKLDLPLQLYAPYFCDDNVYDIANGGKYPFVSANTSLPGCSNYRFKNVAPDASRAFYEFFLAFGKAEGMVAFEPDFMQENYMCVPEFRRNLSAAPTWMHGMASAALATVGGPTPIQFCMATPNDLLESLTMPVVTNFRSSNDFYYGSSYRIGVSSLLIWSLGAVPSKDTFWSTDNSGVLSNCSSELHNVNGCLGGCPAGGCPPDHGNETAVLHTMLALLSMGPVGLSDALGQTNASLLRATCNVAGLLLKPSKPLTTIDRQLLADAASSANFDDRGHPVSGGNSDLTTAPTVLSSFSRIAANETAAPNAWYMLSHGSWTGAPFAVLASDVHPRVAAGTRLAVWRWRVGGLDCASGAAAARCGVRVLPPSAASSALATLQSAAADAELTGTLRVAARVCASSGWALLGETAAFAALSPQRFAAMECTASGLSVSVAGASGETVAVAAVDAKAAAAVVVIVNVTIPAAGTIAISFPPSSQQLE